MSYAEQLTIYTDGDAQASPVTLDRLNGPANYKGEFAGVFGLDSMDMTISHSMISAKPSQGLPAREKHTFALQRTDGDVSGTSFGATARVTIIVDGADTFSDAEVTEVVVSALNFIEDPANLAKFLNKES